MHHFTKHSYTRLLALCLSAGLIMGSLSGCSNQGQGNGTTDTIVESASASWTGVTDITAFPMPEGPAAFPMIFTGAWTPLQYWLWRTAV